MLFVDRDVACRLEAVEASATADYAQAMLLLQPDAPSVCEHVGGGTATFVAPGLPVNRAVGLGMRGPVRSADVDSVEDFYRQRQSPVLVDVCPLADSSLSELLGQRGYRIVRFFNTLVRPLIPDESQLDPQPSDIVIQEIGQAEAELWALTASQGFTGLTRIPEDDISLLLARLAVRRPDVSCFLATLEGIPAGAGALLVRDDLAVLFSASTRPEFRRRGVQSALIRARLAAAVAAGCNLATVSPLPGTGSQHNLQRHGYAVAYTRLTMIRELG